MGTTTRIAWCDSTFNPWLGCIRVSPACDHCYAAALSWRTGRRDHDGLDLLKALSIAASGAIPFFNTSNSATLNTCSASTSAIAGL
jgi:protein gp37